MGNSQEPQDFNISVMPSSLTPVHVAKAAEGLNLYDTASHQVSHFVPLKPGEVGIYVCGATVQSSPHIGHIRAAVAFDIVRRWFLKLGYKVTFVRNVTDIDDKILVKAAAAGQRWWARAYYYEREFTEAYNTLGVLPPTVEPRATGHMSDMIDLIQRILDNGHGYVVTDADGKPTGNVYFDVASWPHYGELTHQKQTSEVDEAAAVADRMGPSVDATGADKYNPVDPADASPDKHDPRDFALWKAPKDTDPEDARWSTPFGVGRPGWHIECSAMSHRYLGDGFDIHGGGLDLRFPHHENEMAQTRAAGYPSAARWMHSAWVTAKGEKMSKSKGNGMKPADLVKIFGVDAYRYYFMSDVQFGHDGNISMERMVQVYNADLANTWGNLCSRVFNMTKKYFDGKVPEVPADAAARVANPMLPIAEGLYAKYDACLGQVDFTGAAAAVQELAGRVNLYVEESAPWNLAKKEETAGDLAAVIYNSLEAIRIIALYMAPFMPNTSAEVFSRLGLGDIAACTDIEAATKWGQLPAGNVVTVGDPLFPRLNMDEIDLDAE